MYELLSSELTNCPQAVAVLGELAAHMVSLRRVEPEAVSAQSLANAIEGLNRTRFGGSGDLLRLKDVIDSSRRAGQKTRHPEDSHVISPHGWGMSTRSMRRGC